VPLDTSRPGAPRVDATATDRCTNQAGASFVASVGFAPIAGKTFAPIAGKTFNAEPISGIVLVKGVHARRFVRLTKPSQLTIGAIIDARKGRVRITIDNGRGGFDTADFYEGVFKLTQPPVKKGRTWFADLFLYGGSFKGCPEAPKSPKLAALAKARSPHRSIRHLWGSGHGAFRTVGRFSSATIRGTTWLTDDKCNGTLTKVTAGKVGVRDFVLKKTIVVKKGKSYFAKPRSKR